MHRGTCFLGWVLAAAAAGCGGADVAADEADVRDEDDSVIARECEAFAEEHAGDEVFAGGVTVDCAAGFHHYASTVETRDPAPGETLRVANFNVYHLGDDQGRYKSYDVVADMMNQWDVVSAVELMTPNGDAIRHNGVVRKQRELGQESDEVRIRLPGYLQLLRELMRKDPSWSLVMTPIPLQEPGASHAELTGFYYRKSRVALDGTALCEDFACVASVEALQEANGLDEEPLIARRPFAAGFRAGTFDFSLVGVHVRFRAPEGVPAPFEGVDRLSSFRLLETQLVANWIGHRLERSADKDVLFVGDFNLEYTQMASVDAFTPSGNPRQEVTYEAQWAQALAGFDGAKVFVTREATSLSSKGSVNNYDHLIFNPIDTAECITDVEPHAYDFTNPDTMPPSYAALLTPEGIDSYVAARLDEVTSCKTFKGGGAVKRIASCELPAKLAKIGDALDELAEDVKAGLFAVHTPLVSDHLPVVVACRIAAEDDD